MIIDPRLMNVVEWTDRMSLLVDKYGQVMQLRDPEDWRLWATLMNNQIGLSDATLNPYSYDSWLPWAIRFSQLAEPLLS